MSDDHYHVMTPRLSYEDAKTVMSALPHKLLDSAGFGFSIVKHDENNEEIDNL